MLRNSILLRLALVAVGLLVGLSIVLVVANTQDDPVCQVPFVELPEDMGADTSETEVQVSVVGDPERGAFIGEARRSGRSTIVAYVNGLPITAADIAESRAQFVMGWESTREAVSRMEADLRLGSGPRGTRFAPGGVGLARDQRGPIPESYGPIEYLRARIELSELHEADTIVLASAIQDRALFTAATAAGHSCDDDDIAPWVEQTKTLLAEGLAPELEAYLSAVGEEVYFNDLLPRALVQRNTITSWRLAVYDEVIFPEDPHLKWREAARDAFLDARVTLTNESHLDATFEDAITYMEALWALDDSPTP